MVGNNSTIFVPLAACQEYYLEHTIKSAIAMAEHPDRIYFGVFNQIADKKYSLLDSDLFKNNNRVMYAEVICKYPLGVGTGRMNASLLSTMNHDFVFQTDAHTIFTKNWDSLLINAYETLQKDIGTDKVVLSGTQGGGFVNDPNDRETLLFLHPQIGKQSIDIFYDNNLHEDDSLKTGKSKFVFENNNGFVFPVSKEDHFPHEKHYEEIYSILATFMFAPYSVIRDVMHDPQDPYHGDQTNYSLRLLSRGYRIFCPTKPALVSMGKFSNNGQSLIDEEYHWMSKKYFNQDRSDFMKENAIKNYIKIVEGSYLGYWGAPDAESLQHAKDKMGFPKS